ncbi:MAG: 30S ribosomal protein S20 [Planctomycetaceae bacterium]|nr:30S ribosomal protein S20 [Planctomycetaceae bacterium]
MPNTKSAKKRQKQNLVRRARNKAVTSAVKTQLKKARAAVKAGDLTAGATESKLAQKKVDQAAAKGVVHRNAAARAKSRLSAALKKAKAAAAGK